MKSLSSEVSDLKTVGNAGKLFRDALGNLMKLLKVYSWVSHTQLKLNSKNSLNNQSFFNSRNTGVFKKKGKPDSQIMFTVRNKVYYTVIVFLYGITQFRFSH